MEPQISELSVTEPRKGGNNLIRKIQGFLRRGTKPHEQAEQSLTPYDEGAVQFAEVARIMREQGRVIGENVYKAYETSFQNPPGPGGGWEDNEHNVMVIDGETNRRIFVYILPEGVKAEGYNLYPRPRVMFHYKKTGDKWNYDGASVGASAGYMDVDFGDEKDLEPTFKEFLLKNRIKMADMERALGRFLPSKP